MLRESYHEFGRLVQSAGGDVVMIIKGNTKASRADLELFLKTSRLIGILGDQMSRSRKAMVV